VDRVHNDWQLLFLSRQRRYNRAQLGAVIEAMGVFG
jgi:hypothetical protein